MSRSAALLTTFGVVVIAALTLLSLGRSPICTCGEVWLWTSERDGFATSQLLADWYSPSHILHGFLFYAVLWVLARKWPVEWRLLVAMAIEAGWEIAENTPFIIDRYREAAAAAGYNGDSVLNSVSDMAMMALGFFLARRLPLWTTITAVLVLELVPLLVIRDNLTLNVIALIAPSDAIAAWQSNI